MGKENSGTRPERQGEALRMSVGVTLMDDTIDVYVLDKKVESNDDNDLNLETIKDMGMKLATNTKENDGDGLRLRRRVWPANFWNTTT